jgi:hypothetical protein
MLLRIGVTDPKLIVSDNPQGAAYLTHRHKFADNPNYITVKHFRAYSPNDNKGYNHRYLP